MRHVHRTHRVDLDWLYERFSSSNSCCRLRYVSTKHQIADMHIKAITKSIVWTHLCKLVQIVRIPRIGSNQAGSNSSRTKHLCWIAGVSHTPWVCLPLLLDSPPPEAVLSSPSHTHCFNIPCAFIRNKTFEFESRIMKVNMFLLRQVRRVEQGYGRDRIT